MTQQMIDVRSLATMGALHVVSDEGAIGVTYAVLDDCVFVRFDDGEVVVTPLATLTEWVIAFDTRAKAEAYHAKTHKKDEAA